MKNDNFIFTVFDLARFLGKKAPTIRQWERKGLIQPTRESGEKRKFTVDEVREIAKIAHHRERITRQRLDMIEAACTILSLIEGEK